MVQARRQRGMQRARQRRLGLTGATTDLLGTPVGIALPLQSRRPGIVTSVCVGELAAAAAAIVTGSLIAFGVLVALALGVVSLGASNTRRVLAITSTGVLILAASARGKPLAVIGPAPDNLGLPEPSGAGSALTLAGRRWWVDRADFPRLERARQLLRTVPAIGDGSPESSS